MRKSIFPSAKEAFPVIVITVLFLLLTAVCIGLRAEHFLMTGLFVVLFFAGKTTRKLAVALLPFIIFGISYDWMRVYPNYQVNPIDVQGLYEAEKSLFGISLGGTTLIPCEYFAQNHCSIADLLGACSYRIRFVALFERRTYSVSPFLHGFSVGKSYRVCRILYLSGSSALVRHELWLRAYS